MLQTPAEVHADHRFQVLEVKNQWEIRTFNEEDPDFPAFFRSDCLAVQLRHLPSGISIFSPSRRTDQKFELYLPHPYVPREGETMLPQAGRAIQVFRAECYCALCRLLAQEFHIDPLPRWEFRIYEMMSRTGPVENV